MSKIENNKICSSCSQLLPRRFNFCPHCSSRLTSGENEQIRIEINANRTRSDSNDSNRLPSTDLTYSHSKKNHANKIDSILNTRDEEDEIIEGEARGITRRWFVIANIAGLIVLSSMEGREEYASIIGLLTIFAVGIVIQAFLLHFRLINIGVNSPWIIFWGLIPIINIPVTLCCLLLPHDFYFTRTLDSKAVFIISLLLFLVFGTFVGFLIS